jgi:hypothetical protein
MSATAEEVTAETAVERKPAPPITLSRLKESQYARTVYTLTVPNDTSPQDLLRDTYWQHIATKFRVRDRIEVMPDNGRWFVELIVMDCGRQFAHVEVMRVKDFVKVAKHTSETAPYKIEYSGPHVKYQIIKDGVALSKGHETEDAARRWVKSHIEASRR